MTLRRPVPVLALLFCLATPAWGEVFDAGNRVIGTMKSHVVKEGETLVELARRYRLGFNELADANPGVDPFVPDPGTRLVVPASWILPDVPPTAVVVINVSELRLYYFFNSGGRRRLMTFPVGIGIEGNETPVGSYRVKEKRELPSWRVPASIRREQPELPAVVPPGDENPLGSHAMRLSNSSILIHGTNRPWGVGRRASHGCIRLYPEDIPLLFDRVAPQDEVRIVRQPVKVGERGGRVYVEVHDDSAVPDHLRLAEELLKRRGLLGAVDWSKVVHAVGEKHGFPVDVTNGGAEVAGREGRS